MATEPVDGPFGPATGTLLVTADAYDAFTRSLQLVSVRFARALVQAPAIYVANPARRLVSSTTRGGRYLNFSNGFAATLEFQFRGWWQDEPATGVTAEAEVGVLSRSPVPMIDGMFQVFKDRHLAGHTWPYLREFLHTALGRTGWPVMTLPLFPQTPVPPRSAAAPGGLTP